MSKCNKIGYWTKAEAKEDIVFMGWNQKRWSKQSKKRQNGRKSHVYQCHFCGWWHTSTTNR